ncbi:hypothetical protein LCGC14_2375170 [marine sediment metagenome]|uniref:Uncharacterized protein n=1 Tax=marine sediment metagenome TaxID=412755 RepID=A0A0F9EF02_9ZZZZ
MEKSGNIPTMFPKGTIVKFNGVPCELLQDTPYFSGTFKGKRRWASQPGVEADGLTKSDCPSCKPSHEAGVSCLRCGSEPPAA